jgi:hypothetical protein
MIVALKEYFPSEREARYHRYISFPLIKLKAGELAWSVIDAKSSPKAVFSRVKTAGFPLMDPRTDADLLYGSLVSRNIASRILSFKTRSKLNDLKSSSSE